MLAQQAQTPYIDMGARAREHSQRVCFPRAGKAAGALADSSSCTCLSGQSDK